jgi:hypothetical protein
VVDVGCVGRRGIRDGVGQGRKIMRLGRSSQPREHEVSVYDLPAKPRLEFEVLDDYSKAGMRRIAKGRAGDIPLPP